MTLPNKLSLSRILVIPFFLFFVLFEDLAPGNLWLVGAFRGVALLLVIGATITDYYDGMLARKYNMSTALGKLLDPLADKILIASAFVAFVDLRIFPSWLVIAILFREFLVTGLRSLGMAQGRVIQADRWGKHKTGWQLATIITAITFLTARDFMRAAGVWDRPLVREWYADIIFHHVLIALLLICVFFTCFSGFLYVWKNRDLLRETPPEKSHD